MRIAIIAFTNPFVNKSDGGKIDIYNRLLALSKGDVSIDFYSILKSDEKEINCDVKNVNIYLGKVENRITYLFNKYPLSVNNRYSAEIRNVMHHRRYDLAIFENLNMIKYVDNGDINCRLKYLRVHNIESSYRKDTFKSSLPRPVALLQYIEGKKYKKVENGCLDKFDKFLFISKDEQNDYVKTFPNYKHKFVWVPPVVECKESVKINNIKANIILFYGDMTVSHNIEGIRWFAKNVFPEVLLKNSSILLNIVGKISEKDKKSLSKIHNQIKVLGYVDDLDKIIEEATVVVAPIFHGAGVKIKVLHALSCGKILIATKKAIEGTDFVDNIHLAIANSKEEYVSKCFDILKNFNRYLYMPKNALEHIKSKYSIRSQGEIIINEYIKDRKINDD